MVVVVVQVVAVQVEEAIVEAEAVFMLIRTWGALPIELVAS